MAKYFIDTEFIEGFHKPLFGKRRHFIDLISIGIYCEDGRSYYAISNEFNPKDADEWVKNNVILPAYRDLPPFKKEHMSPLNFHKAVGKSNNLIANEIKAFICSYEQASEYAGVGSIDSGYEWFLKMNTPEFYAYYADYDWVLFCSLFGRMLDLPVGFPMYCHDLKQTLDEKQLTYRQKFNNKAYLAPHQRDIKLSEDYPIQKNEHNAVEDAEWNYKLYKFLQTI